MLNGRGTERSGGLAPGPPRGTPLERADMRHGSRGRCWARLEISTIAKLTEVGNIGPRMYLLKFGQPTHTYTHHRTPVQMKTSALATFSFDAVQKGSPN